jgi:DNA ligase-1
MKPLIEEIENKNLHNIEVVKVVYQGTDQSQINKWLDYAVEHDWEGCMINKDATYKCKRTTDLIKVKRFYTMDLKVVDVLEGDGRLKGTLGALVVEFKGNTVNVGSGYSDDQRTEIWNNKEDMIGKIVEIKYKEITSDKKTGLESLQFPIFCSFRDDKTEPSYN